MDIDWNTVKPGETVLVFDEGYGVQGVEFKVLRVSDAGVIIHSQMFEAPQMYVKSDFKNCHIKSKWREITGECSYGFAGDLLVIMQNGFPILKEEITSGRFKIEWPKVFTCN